MRILIALLFVAGCAQSARQPGLPGAGPTPANEVAALERELDMSEHELGEQIDLRLGSLQGARSKAEQSEAKADDKDEAAERAEKPKTAPTAEAAGEAPPATQAPSEESTKPESPCENACRALGSMRRSAERICVLVGAQDARCTRARERVRAAETRVATAGCACADDGQPDGGA